MRRGQVRVADPEPVRAVGAPQTTRRHRPGAGRDVLVALVQAGMGRQAVEQQQAQVPVRPEVLPGMLGPTLGRARLNDQPQPLALGRQPATQLTI